MKSCPQPWIISSATALVAPDLLKSLAILLDITVIRSKTILEIRKKITFLYKINNLLFTNFSKALLTTKRRLTGQYFLVVDLSLTFLNTVTTNKTFQQCGKKHSLLHLYKSSASM